jgi:hypothetical protein
MGDSSSFYIKLLVPRMAVFAHVHLTLMVVKYHGNRRERRGGVLRCDLAYGDPVGGFLATWVEPFALSLSLT